MPGLLETDSFSAQDITSVLLIGSYTASAAGLVMAQVRLNSLNGAAAVITLKMVLNDGSNDHPHARGSDLKDAGADTRFARDLSPVWMSSGDVLKVYALSSNASDTSVSGDVRFVDAGNPVDAVSANLTEVGGAAINGAGSLDGSGRLVVGSVFDGVDVTKISGSETAADNVELAGLAYSATRGLAGTALPDAAADAAGGLAISDAGGLDLDAIKAVTDALPDSGALSTIDGKLDTIAGYIDTEVGTLLTNLADVLVDTGTTLDGKLDAIKTVTDALGISSATGTASAASAGATSLTVAGLDMDASNYKRQYLILEEGDGKGWASEILASSTGTTINLKDALPADVSASDAVRIAGKAR